MRVHVDGVQPVVPREELLPQGPQRQLPSHQKQEGDLRHAALRRAADLGDQGSSPEELLVAHVVHHAARSKQVYQLRLRFPGRR
jgi:hypothetical protein